jgi:hypothetical protein
MKVVPSQTGVTAAARTREQRTDRAAFGAALAQAKDVELRKGEKTEPVAGHAYADIVSGKRSGMFINTSGNARHGEAFVLVRKGGVEYHIYGSGKDRLVVALRPAAEAKPEPKPDPAEKAKPELTPDPAEKLEPVEGRGYSEIVSGKRSGMYVNTTGGPRDGEAFVLANRGGVEYHIYGSGKDREIVAVKR